MISAHARDSFERILQKAVTTRLTRSPDAFCEIVPIKDARAADVTTSGEISANVPPTKHHDNVVVLTISSLVFRMLLVLHFDENDATTAYYLGDDEDKAFREVFLELSNLCCGVINQELLPYFPDLGMSTPYVLSARCVPHLTQLKPNHLASWAITLDDSVQLAATLCVCANAPIDFVADVNMADESSGELEMF